VSSIKHPCVYKDSVLQLFLEQHVYWGLFIHCYVCGWNKKTIKHLSDVWDNFLDEIKSKGFDKVHAAVLEEDDKLRKFSSYFGFISTGTFITDTDGNIREVFECLT